MNKVQRLVMGSFFLGAYAFFLLSSGGCEMTRGLGKDIENTGKNIQRALNKVGGPADSSGSKVGD